MFCSLSGEIIKVVKHKHGGEQAVLESKEIVNKIKSEAKVNGNRPGSVIIAENVATANEDVHGQLPSISLLNRTIQRTREQQRPPAPLNPETLDDLLVTEAYSKTLRGDKFLYFDYKIGTQESSRVLIFTTEKKKNMATLENCETWMADGTFDCVPRIFSQLYTVHGYINRQALPLVYVLTSSKTTKVYCDILSKLLEINNRLSPKYVVCDFELAFHKAMLSVFPQVKIVGCFFHFCQHVYDKIRKSGLQQIYNTNSKVALQLKMVSCLAFVPEDDVIHGYEKLIESPYFQENEGSLSPLLDYMEDTWIGVKSKRRANRRPPHFPIKLWNQYECVINNIPRTNNGVEGWHHGLNTRAEASHLTIWRMIELLKKEQGLTEFKINQIESGESPPKRRRVYERIDVRLSNLVENYDKNDVSKYLKGIAANIKY